MIQIICTAISAVATVVVAVIGYRLNKVHAEEEMRAKRRKTENILSLEMAIATMELSEVCANALTGGRNNGNVTEAKRKCEEARKKYKDFQKEVVAEEIV